MFSLCGVIGDGPGYLPLKWKKGKKDTSECSMKRSELLFCDKCLGYQAPRSSHCHVCGRCVLKMSHHCAWLNVCVGHFNQRYFLLFLITSLLTSAQSSATLSIGLRKYFRFQSTDPQDVLPTPALINLVCCVGVSAGIMFSVIIFLFKQLRSIVFNMTDSEKELFQKVLKWRTFLKGLILFLDKNDFIQF